MKILKYTLSVIMVLLTFLSPLIFIVAYAVSLPPVYSQTFFGALNEKYDRLNSLEGEKIVVVGGSSVAFGLDSELLEKYTGMPVVNFGLYADLGTKMMLDLSLSGISDGDVVILAPELDRQTMSLFFNHESALMSLDDDFSMIRHLEVGDIFSCIGGSWRFAQDKRARLSGEKPIALDPIYRSEYFNEYGDFALPREENVMPYYYDRNTQIGLSEESYGSELYEFFDYLNRYIRKCKLRGATVYFSVCPINSMAVEGKFDSEDILGFEELIRENVNCELISEIGDYILDAGYFFDTNYHLNDAGVAVRTIRLAKDLRIAAGIMNGPLDEEPEAPALPFFDVSYDGEDDPVCIYYEFSELSDGSYAISGLTEEGKNKSELEIPRGINGRKVTAILSGAFDGASCERVIIGADTNIVIIHNGAFYGARSLKDLSIYVMNASDIMPPVDFIGVHSDFAIHVPIGSSYGDNYDWSNKADYVYDLIVK